MTTTKRSQGASSPALFRGAHESVRPPELQAAGMEATAEKDIVGMGLETATRQGVAHEHTRRRSAPKSSYRWSGRFALAGMTLDAGAIGGVEVGGVKFSDQSPSKTAGPSSVSNRPLRRLDRRVAQRLPTVHKAATERPFLIAAPFELEYRRGRDGQPYVVAAEP